MPNKRLALLPCGLRANLFSKQLHRGRKYQREVLTKPDLVASRDIFSSVTVRCL